MKTLDNVQVGDKVAYTNQWYSTGWHEGYQIWQPATAEKVTKTQITVNGTVFLKNSGKRLGDTHSYSNHNPQIQVWTEAIEKKITETELAIKDFEVRRELLNKIDKVQFKYLSTNTLQTIVNAIEAE